MVLAGGPMPRSECPWEALTLCSGGPSSESSALERPCGLSLVWGGGASSLGHSQDGCVSGAVRAPRARACGGPLCAHRSRTSPPQPICGAKEVGGRRRLAGSSAPPRDTPTLPGRACRGCERPLPDPEVDHAQAEKEVAQAAPRLDRKSTRLNSSHKHRSRMPSSA